MLDLWRPGSPLTWRKLGVLVDYLPPESATMTSVRAATPELAGEAAERTDASARPWSAEAMLLAALVDSVRQVGWLYAASHLKRPPPHPEPIERPGIRARERKTMTVAAYRAMTGQEPPLHLVRGTG